MRAWQACRSPDLRLEDFEHQGRTVQASRLGHRINELFVTTYFGRIFLHPDVVFTEQMLKPELQDLDVFAESIDVIVATHQRTAQAYFDDGTIRLAVPPLRALLEIMAHGSSKEGWTLDSPDFRRLFQRRTILDSGWYAQRLSAKQAADALLKMSRGVPVEAKVAAMAMSERACTSSPCRRRTGARSRN